MSEPRKKRGPVSYSTYQEAKDRIAELEAENARLRERNVLVSFERDAYAEAENKLRFHSTGDV